MTNLDDAKAGHPAYSAAEMPESYDYFLYSDGLWAS